MRDCLSREAICAKCLEDFSHAVLKRLRSPPQKGSQNPAKSDLNRKYCFTSVLVFYKFLRLAQCEHDRSAQFQALCTLATHAAQTNANCAIIVDSKGIPTLLGLLGTDLHGKSLYQLRRIIHSLVADCTAFKEELISEGAYELLRSLKLRE
jgi:hypothetical protein